MQQFHPYRSLVALLFALVPVVLAGCPGDNKAVKEATELAQAQAEAKRAAAERSEDVAEITPDQAPPPRVYDPGRPLSEQYAEMKAAQVQPEEARRVFADQRAVLEELGMIEAATAVGDTAPSFVLPANTGGAIALDTALTRGPVVLVFFRGGW